MPGRRLKDRPLAGLAAEHRAPHEGGAVHLLASLNAHDVGLLTTELTTPVPRQCPGGQPSAGPTATPPGARGKGVRHALAGTALTWAHDHGYQPAWPTSTSTPVRADNFVHVMRPADIR